ncbi:hypothetical protein Ae201684P_020842 [Aphanomyces euteiches]|nr:hypothetical protein Ae201684P_020842 [Aphanomyces euteiches]
MASNSSDYVARFKLIYLSNPTSGTVSYDGVVIPASVTSRLEAVGLTFASLPNLMRQALLWDMGLVVGEVNGVDMLMQVLVQANATMASIALSFEEYGQSTAGRGLKSTNCSFNNQTYLRQEQMDGTNLAFILKCAVELVSVDASSSIIAQDALPASVIPQPRLYKHQDVTQGWTLPAIHTLPRTAPGASGEATYAKCPTDASHQALIIPCETKFQRSESLNINLPTPSAAMTAWLQEFKATNPDLGDSSSSKSHRRLQHRSPSFDSSGGCFYLVSTETTSTASHGPRHCLYTWPTDSFPPPRLTWQTARWRFWLHDICVWWRVRSSKVQSSHGSRWS